MKVTAYIHKPHVIVYRANVEIPDDTDDADIKGEVLDKYEPDPCDIYEEYGDDAYVDIVTVEKRDEITITANNGVRE